MHRNSRECCTILSKTCKIHTFLIFSLQSKAMVGWWFHERIGQIFCTSRDKIDTSSFFLHLCDANLPAAWSSFYHLVLKHEGFFFPYKHQSTGKIKLPD